MGPHPDYARRSTRQVPDYCTHVSIAIIFWYEVGPLTGPVFHTTAKVTRGRADSPGGLRQNG